MDEDQESAGKRPPNFRLQIPGGEDFKRHIQEKLQLVKSYLTTSLNKPVNNAAVIEELLDFWIRNHNDEETQIKHAFPCLYKQVQKGQVNQGAFVTADTSLDLFGELYEAHTSICDGKLRVIKRTMKGHVVAARLQCSSNKAHVYLWSSSPYLPNDEYLINHRINHAFNCSGMLPIHYNRFSVSAGIGCINQERRKKFFQKYKDSAENEVNQSCQNALFEEIGTYEELDGINIMSDARHGWRKNAKDTSVVALGENTHKVIDCVHITKAEDHVSQRHEKVGTQRIYDNLNQKNVDIKIHSHDRNVSINKFIKDTNFTVNQNDLWHAVKKVKKAMTNISKGALKNEGKTWSEQLADKVEPVVTHINWAVRNCENDPVKLKHSLDNITEHYSNNHSRCHQMSRCQMDPNYEPSRIVLKNPSAIKLLNSVIQKCTIYTSPKDYVLVKDTSYVESFNNVMNVFQDKRISFSDDQYKFRSNLAVCHWNENVDRGYTSIWKSNNPNAPRNQKGKKVYKKLTYDYRKNIWDHYITTLF